MNKAEVWHFWPHVSGTTSSVHAPALSGFIIGFHLRISHASEEARKLDAEKKIFPHKVLRLGSEAKRKSKF